MEDLCQITHHELNASPRSPPPTPWGHPSGSGNPNEDDQEVTILRGGGWVPQDNHLHLLPQCDKMEDGFLRDHLLNLKFLLNLIQMWGT